MKFSIGDKIVLNRTGEEGHVTAYISHDMIEVDVNGVTFPVHLDEIDHPYLKWFTDKKVKKAAAPPEQLPVEKQKFRKPRLAKGVYLSFLPVFKIEEMEDIVDHLKVYLINELPQAIQFRYEMRFLEKTEFSHEGKLHGFGHLYIHSIPYDDMNDQPRFHWYLSDANTANMQPEQGILRIRPSKLFEHINELLEKNEATFSYLLVDQFVEKKKQPPPEKFVLPKKAPVLTLANITELVEQPKYELDLHIEQLVKSKKGMSNAEIVKLQIDTLRHYLQLALLHRQQRMFIIHGVGKGVLREEVHKELRATSHIEHYTNEYHPRYGFGATEVFFSY